MPWAFLAVPWKNVGFPWPCMDKCFSAVAMPWEKKSYEITCIVGTPPPHHQHGRGAGGGYVDENMKLLCVRADGAHLEPHSPVPRAVCVARVHGSPRL